MSARDTDIGAAEADTDLQLESAAPTPGGLQGVVFGTKYQLVREIGRGGMGSVWTAERLGWGREAPVAVKLMTLPDTPVARERFEREVKLAATLRSPHVVQVLDHGIDEATQIPFIVMELLEGENLAVRLRRLGCLSPAEVMMIVTHLGRALTRAHEAGIVHRDLKPDNVYLVNNGDEPLVKVLDFGVAKGSQQPTLGRNTITAEGKTVGTPWYMSPEQLRGKRLLDPRLDLWSLAVIACECLTGKRPFFAEDFPELAMLLCGDRPRPVPSTLGSVPVGFDDWFARATAKDIDERFQMAQELTDALRPICGDSPRNQVMPAIVQTAAAIVAADDSAIVNLPSMAPVSRTDEGPVFFFRRGPRLLAGIIAGLVLGLAAMTLAFSHWRTPLQVPPAASNSAAPSDATVNSLRPPVSAREPTPAPVAAAEGSVPAPESPPEEPTAVSTEGSPTPSAETSVAPTAASVASPRARAAASAQPLRKKRHRPPNEVPQLPPAKPEDFGTIEGDRIIRTEL